MIDRSEKAIIPFAPGSKQSVPDFAPASKQSVPDNGDPVEKSGQAIVGLIKGAAETSRAACEQATNTAEKLFQQLHATEDKIKELELDAQHYYDRAARAEKWLARIHEEIEGKFFGPSSVAVAGKGIPAMVNRDSSSSR